MSCPTFTQNSRSLPPNIALGPVQGVGWLAHRHDIHHRVGCGIMPDRRTVSTPRPPSLSSPPYEATTIINQHPCPACVGPSQALLAVGATVRWLLVHAHDLFSLSVANLGGVASSRLTCPVSTSHYCQLDSRAPCNMQLKHRRTRTSPHVERGMVGSPHYKPCNPSLVTPPPLLSIV
jgi:hypothetical protein